MQIQIAAGGSARIQQLTDQEGAGGINAGVLAEAQAKADAWIHSYVRLRHAVPVVNLSTEGAATLARLEADETVYQLIQVSRVVDQSDHDKRKERERELEMIRDGKLRIDEPLPAQSTAVQATIVHRDGPISRHGLRGIL